MNKIRTRLNSKEKIILMILHKEGGFMTAHEISQKTGISYVTVRKYLRKLTKEGIIIQNE